MMKNWWQKSLMIAVAVLTLGAISPNHTLWETFLEDKGSPKSHETESGNRDYTYEWVDLSEYYDNPRLVAGVLGVAASLPQCVLSPRGAALA